MLTCLTESHLAWDIVKSFNCFSREVRPPIFRARRPYNSVDKKFNILPFISISLPLPFHSYEIQGRSLGSRQGSGFPAEKITEHLEYELLASEPAYPNPLLIRIGRVASFVQNGKNRTPLNEMQGN